MNKKYFVLAGLLLVLLLTAFGFFATGFINGSSQMIGGAFIAVGFSLLVGYFGNRLLEKNGQVPAENESAPVIVKATPQTLPSALSSAEEKTPSQKLLEAVESLPAFASEGPASQKLATAGNDLSNMLVGFIFGGIALTFFGLGIWLMLFGQSFLG